MHAFCGAAEVKLVGHCDEVPQLTQFHQPSLGGFVCHWPYLVTAIAVNAISRGRQVNPFMPSTPVAYPQVVWRTHTLLHV